jgi:hypothetical protein
MRLAITAIIGSVDNMRMKVIASTIAGTQLAAMKTPRQGVVSA